MNMKIGLINLDIKPSVNRFVKKQMTLFLEWFEDTYDMEKPVNIIITGAKYVVSIDWEKVSATCFCAYDDIEHENILIKVSTGDFFDLLNDTSKSDAVYTTVHSVLHELQHYYQFVNDWPLDEDEAVDIGNDLTYEYIDYVNENIDKYVGLYKTPNTTMKKYIPRAKRKKHARATEHKGGE